MCSVEACVQHGDVYHGRPRTMRKPIAADVDDGDHRDRERLPRRRHARQQPVDGGVVRHVEDELIHDAVGADRPGNELKPGVARVATRRHIRKRGMPPRRRLGTPEDKVVSVEYSQIFSTDSPRHLRQILDFASAHRGLQSTVGMWFTYGSSWKVQSVTLQLTSPKKRTHHHRAHALRNTALLEWQSAYIHCIEPCSNQPQTHSGSAPPRCSLGQSMARPSASSRTLPCACAIVPLDPV
jgi:hypothetical protein